MKALLTFAVFIGVLGAACDGVPDPTWVDADYRLTHYGSDPLPAETFHGTDVWILEAGTLKLQADGVSIVTWSWSVTPRTGGVDPSVVADTTTQRYGIEEDWIWLGYRSRECDDTSACIWRADGRFAQSHVELDVGTGAPLYTYEVVDR